jgi:hypothetical protein
VSFPTEALMLVTVKIALSLIPDGISGITIYLIVDDTLQAKYGDQFDCYSKLFDHAKHNGTNYLNGHCFVSLVISIPVDFRGQIKYITLPVGYKLYDKTRSKLEIASAMIDTVMPLISQYKAIVLCDSWYTKKPFVYIETKYSNLSIIGAVRGDTRLYGQKPEKTGKRGRPSTKGPLLNIKDFIYQKYDDYYIATKEVLTNLFDHPVLVTVTTTDTEKFSSVRLYICTISPKEVIKEYKCTSNEGNSCNDKYELVPFILYKFRWSIEVIFYQHKFFWSFGNYMVRNKEAIERYVNLLAIAYTFVVVLPFLHPKFSQYKLQSPQEIKNAVSYQLSKELILSTFVQELKKSKISSSLIKTINSLISLNDIA